jgi:hypothetical protein
MQTPCMGTSLVSAKMRPEPQFDCAWQQMAFPKVHHPHRRGQPGQEGRSTARAQGVLWAQNEAGLRLKKLLAVEFAGPVMKPDLRHA